MARKISEAVEKEALRRVEAGEVKAAVARDMGLSIATIHKLTRHVIRQVEVPMTPEQRVEMERLLMAGIPCSEIARRLKANASIVRFHSAKLAKQLLAGDGIDEAKKSAIRAARSEGMSINDMAAKLGIPVIVVNALVDAKSGKVKGIPDNLKRQAVQAVAAGDKLSQAADRFGFSSATIGKWVKAAVQRGEVTKPQRMTRSDDHAFNWMTKLHPALEAWRQLYVSFVETARPSFSTSMSTAKSYFQDYLVGQALPLLPADFLRRANPDPPDFYSTCLANLKDGKRRNTLIYNFIEWVLDSPNFADTSDGEPIRATNLFRNPINPDPDVDPSVGAASRLNQSDKTLLSYWVVADLRKRIVHGPHFRDWTWVRGLSGRETHNGQQQAADWFAVTRDQIDENDPDCVWRIRQREVRGPVLEMWSPARWVHALFHLQTPPRGGQARMVDSGEADALIYRDGAFVANTHKLKQKGRRQGVLHMPTPEDATAGATIILFFNTNKTADSGKSGSAKGFVCPWPRMEQLEEDPYYWLEKLRNWQMKYKPIKKLVRWRDLTGEYKLSAVGQREKAQYLDTAFLFRAPENSQHPDWPMAMGVTKLTWQLLLRSYEEVANVERAAMKPPLKPLELINPANGRPYASQHSTRVSLITHFVMDGGVSPIIMMKVAGHSRFIMTLYYVKVTDGKIREALKAGRAVLDAKAQALLVRDLLTADGERLEATFVFNAEDWKTMLGVNPADRNAVGWLHMHDRICLAGGNTHGDFTTPGCHNGASVGVPKSGRRLHGAVPGGPRNCTRCRWSACGKQHLDGLTATLNNRTFHLEKARQRAVESYRDYARLSQDEALAQAADEPFALDRQTAILQAQRLHESAMAEVTELGLDIAATCRTIERIMALPADANSTALVAQGDDATVKGVLEDVLNNSELLHLAGVCEDLEFYPDLKPGTAVFEFADLLDAALERDGFSPVLARLPEKERLVAGNAIMRQLEQMANPDNTVLGRRAVVQVMDRHESLKALFGDKLAGVVQLASRPGRTAPPLRLVRTEQADDTERTAS